VENRRQTVGGGSLWKGAEKRGKIRIRKTYKGKKKTQRIQDQRDTWKGVKKTGSQTQTEKRKKGRRVPQGPPVGESGRNQRKKIGERGATLRRDKGEEKRTPSRSSYVHRKSGCVLAKKKKVAFDGRGGAESTGKGGEG